VSIKLSLDIGRKSKRFDFLLHDNDTMFTSTEFQSCLSHMNVESVRTSYRSPWQNGICELAVGIFKRVQHFDHSPSIEVSKISFFDKECFYLVHGFPVGQFDCINAVEKPCAVLVCNL